VPTPIEIARSAALAGGRVIREHRNDPGAVRSKGTATDFVTEVDVASGVAVVSSIIAADPSARVIVEEPEVYDILGIAPGGLDDDEVWIIDPIDGTTSFLHGFPAYSVSVALVSSGQPIAGAVYNAAIDEMFTAATGGGASHGSNRIHCSTATSVPEALLVTGFPYARGAPLDRQLTILAAFLRAPVHGIRRDGTAALDCCHVAAGRADGFWEFTLKPWDMAAGVIIAREAGATVTDCEGRPWTIHSDSICAAPKELHTQMLSVITSAGAV